MSEEKKYRRSRFYELVRVLVTILFHTLSPVRCHHTERLPKEGPYLLISNHFSNMDPLIMGYPVKKEQLIFLGKKELMHNRLMAAIARTVSMIPIARGQADMEAMRACMRVLKEGRILGIFPEGTRHHEGIMEEIMDGFALIALRSGVPLVPMLISRKWRLFSVVHVVIGEPVEYQDLRESGVNKDNCAKLIERIRASYSAMQEELKK